MHRNPDIFFISCNSVTPDSYSVLGSLSNGVAAVGVLDWRISRLIDLSSGWTFEFLVVQCDLLQISSAMRREAGAMGCPYYCYCFRDANKFSSFLG
ncbi:hypothetical protein Q3G72_007598 [Acer saccharum]|nr:hypothetical protein Q3G72_007598 [Acer saccharum]